MDSDQLDQAITPQKYHITSPFPHHTLTPSALTPSVPQRIHETLPNTVTFAAGNAEDNEAEAHTSGDDAAASWGNDPQPSTSTDDAAASWDSYYDLLKAVYEAPRDRNAEVADNADIKWMKLALTQTKDTSDNKFKHGRRVQALIMGGVNDQLNDHAEKIVEDAKEHHNELPCFRAFTNSIVD
ncbi:hypothetical protein GGR57DRAFT_499336 [Xylariaceae sp. FL1272]|nr:hypothetical protein GGR57DRAFT_499336 [Xylariaceae sp. FL1272]